MTRALQEPSGLPGSVEKDRRSKRFLAFLETTYRDRAADAGGLAPRMGC